MCKMCFFSLFFSLCLFLSSPLFSSESLSTHFDEHASIQIESQQSDGRRWYDSDDDEWYTLAEAEQDPYQSFSTYKKHLTTLLENRSYIKFALNVSFCIFFVTALFIAPVCLVIYSIMNQPEKYLFDKLYLSVNSLTDVSKDIVLTDSKVGNALSYFFENTTNLTSLVFLAAGERMHHHGHTSEYNSLKSVIEGRISSFFKTRGYKHVFNNTEGFVTRFCFDAHDQEFGIETVTSKTLISDPWNISFKKECEGRQVLAIQNIGKFYRNIDKNGSYYFEPMYNALSIDVHDAYKAVYQTQRRLMQLSGDTSKEGYLTTVENDFLNRTDTQSILAMVIDSLTSSQCPSDALFQKLSITVKGLRAPLRYIGDKYLQIRLWYREDGSVRHVLATSTNNITDRSTNHNDTTPCNFASQAHLDGADARLDLDRYAYLRVIAGGHNPSFTLEDTITKAFQKTFTDHFSKEQTESQTGTGKKTDTPTDSNLNTQSDSTTDDNSLTSTQNKTHTKSMSLLSREQYFDLLAKGVWFNESDAYLNSIFPEMGGLYGPYGAVCDLCPLYGRASYSTMLPNNADGTNSTIFGFLYSLPSRFIFQLFGLSYGSNSNTTTKIYLGKNINSSNYLDVFTGNIPIAFGSPFHYMNASVSVNNPANDSFLRIMIPNPQRDPNGDPRYFGLAYFLMKIIPL